MFEALEPLTPLTTEIRRCILSEDEISDDASSNLRQIRRNMKLTGDRIHTQLSSLVNGSTRNYLQDSVITMRNGRYCIPVKAEYKGQVPGMVHDQSSTGSTLFIEPMAIVKLNNDIRELEMEEQKEIEVILSNLSQQTAEQTDAIRADLSIMVQLDVIFARASLAMDMNATEPIFNDEGRIRLKQARHPLIDKKKAVPIDIRLGDDFDMLVITGPNTGGKTVSLKTVGLLTLMGQSGLHIPTLDRSELALFEEVYADIGDEQSIEQSLSTFSSHMTNVVSFLKKANRHSLVLFDELGAGTDPTEGAALAIAILSHLHEQGIRSLATTHYSELKVYALSTSGVENACCELDVETLRPTYRLLIGVPGKSNAFAIASKLGHPDYIISLRKKAEILLKKGEREEALRLFRSFYKAELDYVKRNFVGMTEQNRLDFWKKEKPLLSEIFSLGEACPEFLYDVALLRRHIALLDRKAVADRKSLDEFCRIDSRQVRKALRPKEVAVEFACYKDLLSADTMYIALVASRDRVRHVALGTRKDLHGYRVGKVTLDEAVCAGARYVDQIYEDTVLAQKIWQPIVKLLPAGTQTLYFAPDGLFQMLGIEYLSSEDLKGLEMRRLSSTAQIVPRQVGPGKKNGADGVLVVGGLAYNECLPEPDTVCI